MSHLICIKIGGSVITDKTKSMTPNQANIATFAENIATAMQRFPDTAVLLGNGAGSFGHHSAHEYGLSGGAKTAEQFYGISVTHNAVRELNLLVGNALTAHDVPAYCVSPGDLFTAADGAVLSANDAVITELLAHGLVPLIHGDTVLDTVRGVSIFSTEKSLFWLSKALRGHYDRISVVMVVDTGGVLNTDGSVISELRRDATIAIASTIPGVQDVTGGITHKVTACREAADWADDVHIVGNTTDDILAIFKGASAGTSVL